MQLLKISTVNCRRAPSALGMQKVPFCKGFSLIELTIVLGILAAASFFTLTITMENYHGNAFIDTQTLIVAALQKARSQAMSGVCMGESCTEGRKHGLYVEGAQLTVFQGNTYNTDDEQNERITLPGRGVLVGGLSEVVFTEFSGIPTQAGDIIISDSMGHTATITIGIEGQIVW